MVVPQDAPPPVPAHRGRSGSARAERGHRRPRAAVVRLAGAPGGGAQGERGGAVGADPGTVCLSSV